MVKSIKRIFLLAIVSLFAIQFWVISPNIANAQDVWIGSQGDANFYIKTETFHKPTDLKFFVDVKCVYDGSKGGKPMNATLNYDFIRRRGSDSGWAYKDEYMRDYIDTTQDGIANNILTYCLKNLF